MGRKVTLVVLHAMGLISCLFFVTAALASIFRILVAWFFPELARDAGGNTAMFFGTLGAVYLMCAVLWPVLGFFYIRFCLKNPNAWMLSIGSAILFCLLVPDALWMLPVAILLGVVLVVKGWVAGVGAKMLILNGAGYLFTRLPDKTPLSDNHGGGSMTGMGGGGSAAPPPPDSTHGSGKIDTL
jgi:hypothetical protein